MSAPSQRVTITGSAASGFTWTCGTCGGSAPRSQPTRGAALVAYDAHYATAPSLTVDPWLLNTLSAGQAMASALVVDPGGLVPAWTAAVQSAPPALIATWQNGGITHPQ